jgi:hypothetical protein
VKSDGARKLQSGASGSGKLMPNAEMACKNFFRAGILARAIVGPITNRVEGASYAAFRAISESFMQLSCSIWV